MKSNVKRKIKINKSTEDRKDCILVKPSNFQGEFNALKIRTVSLSLHRGY